MKSALEKLEKLFKDCQNIGWDGYDAEPLKEIVYLKAKEFLESLSEDLPEPDLFASGDNMIYVWWTNRWTNDLEKRKQVLIGFGDPSEDEDKNEKLFFISNLENTLNHCDILPIEKLAEHLLLLENIIEKEKEIGA